LHGGPTLRKEREAKRTAAFRRLGGYDLDPKGRILGVQGVKGERKNDSGSGPDGKVKRGGSKLNQPPSKVVNWEYIERRNCAFSRVLQYSAGAFGIFFESEEGRGMG